MKSIPSVSNTHRDNANPTTTGEGKPGRKRGEKGKTDKGVQFHG